MDIFVGALCEPAIELVLRARDERGTLRKAARKPAVVFPFFLRLLFKQRCGQCGAEDQRNQGRKNHRRHNGEGELTIDDAGRSTEKCHGKEHSGQNDCDCDQRNLNFPHRLYSRFLGRHVRIFIHQTLDILDHHNGVIHQESDGEDEPEERHRIDREARSVEDSESAEQDDGHRNGGDQGRAPALQENEHHDDDQHDRFDQRFDDFLDR